jgi:hypothetical protein
MHPTPTSAELPRGIPWKRAALVLDLAMGTLLCVIGTAVMPVIFLIAMLAMLRLPKMVKVSRLIGNDHKMQVRLFLMSIVAKLIPLLHPKAVRPEMMTLSRLIASESKDMPLL